MCWKCKNKIDVEFIGRTDECPTCHTDLHSCKNCSFYLPGSHFDCKENIDEKVSDKEKANFCDFFRILRDFDNRSDEIKLAEEKKSVAKASFDALFNI